MTVEFLTTSLIVVLSPGTGAIYTLSTALSRGARASQIAAFGCTLGIIPHMLAAISGLAMVLHTSAVAFQTLKWLGVCYLLYLAWKTLRERGAISLDEGVAPPSASKVIVRAVLINVLNPKLSIFFLAFLPQFVSANEPHPVQKMLLLSAVFMGMTLGVFALYGLFAAAVRDRIIARPVAMSWMRRVFAGSFVLLGARLALSER